MPIRILLTGSNGLIGQKLVQKISLSGNFELLATSLGNCRITSRVCEGGFGYVPMDVTNRQDVRNVFAGFEPQIVIHTAAVSQPDECENHKENCWKLNTDALEHLLRECSRYRARFIHLSSDFVFDGEKGIYTESDIPRPASYYGKSKHAAENIVAGSGVEWAIVRTILVYGFSEGSRRSNILTRILSAAYTHSSISLVTDQFRTPTFVDDLADAIIAVTLRKKNGIYHVSGMENLSVCSFAERILRFWKLDPNIIEPVTSRQLNQPAKRPPNTGFVILKAQTELDYHPHTIEESFSYLNMQEEKYGIRTDGAYS